MPRKFTGLLLMLLWVSGAAAAEQDKMTILRTEEGVRFALFGEPPAEPRATLLVFATRLEDMDTARIYTEAGRQLAQRGWLYVAVEPPCHGEDQQTGEPAGLDGWAHRVAHGQPLMESFTRRASQVLDHLVAKQYTDPARVAACGTSRGGFCALHFAAAEPRVRAVAAVSPVTDLLALREFEGLGREQVESLNIPAIAEQLVGRAIWISIGNHDGRVDSEACIAAYRSLVAAAAGQPNAPARLPLALLVGPSEGHQSIDNAYGLAAEFLGSQVKGER